MQPKTRTLDHCLLYDLIQFHKAVFAHRKLKRPTKISGGAYDYILLSDDSLRLIDTGISSLKTQVGNKLFQKYIEIEIADHSYLKNTFQTFNYFFTGFRNGIVFISGMLE